MAQAANNREILPYPGNFPRFIHTLTAPLYSANRRFLLFFFSVFASIRVLLIGCFLSPLYIVVHSFEKQSPASIVDVICERLGIFFAQ